MHVKGSRAEMRCWTEAPLGSSIDALFLASVAHFVLAWYLGQVCASAEGQPVGASRPPYFPLLPSFWGCARRSKARDSRDAFAEEQHRSETDQSIRLHKLSKNFATETALREVSFEMRSNEIFALLGHNGAGKSTLANVLCGLQNVSNGDAFVRGLSVRQDMSAIQSRIGVCPQDDVIWPDLTAYDNLCAAPAPAPAPASAATAGET